MSINLLFSPKVFETALGRARPISFEMDLARARHTSLPQSFDGVHNERVQSLRRRGHVAAARNAGPDIDHAKIYQRAMESALP